MQEMRRRMKEKIKTRVFKKQLKICVCVSRQGGLPMTNKTATVFTITKIWSWVPEGLDTKTE